MKNYLIYVFCLVAIFSSLNSRSQNSFISLGGEIGIANSVGLKMVAGTLTGGSLRIESSFGKHTAVMVTIGYLSSPEQHPYPSVPATTSTFRILPFQLGIKYYIKEKEDFHQGLFFSSELGLLISTTTFTYESNPENKRKESGLGIAPGIGYMIGNLEPSFRLQFDLSASGFNVYYYNFRVAYGFRNKHKKS